MNTNLKAVKVLAYGYGEGFYKYMIIIIFLFVVISYGFYFGMNRMRKSMEIKETVVEDFLKANLSNFSDVRNSLIISDEISEDLTHL